VLAITRGARPVGLTALLFIFKQPHKSTRSDLILLCGCPGENPKALPGQHKFLIASSARPCGALSTAQSVISAGPLIWTLDL
jgi:hypothetical protein